MTLRGKFSASAIGLVCAGLVCADVRLVELTVRVTGIAQGGGALAIAVFDDSGRFEALEDPVARQFVPVTGGSLSWSAMLPPRGQYAAVVYHDLNDNGALDKGRFGIPREPYGFSNDARSPFGPPGFDEASFAVNEEPLSISIEIR